MTDALPEKEVLRIATLAAERALQRHAAKHPRPSQVNQHQAAEMLGVAPRTVRRYIRAGRLKLNGGGLLSIDAVDALLSSQ